jgi:two-component sensor histidine kinase/CHASE3 domain sensor protein
VPISVRFVVQSTIVLLAVGFATLLSIVGMTIWLGQRSQAYFEEVIDVRDLRSAAVELRSALQGVEASQRGYVATGNEIYLAPYGAAKTQAEDQLEIVKRALARDPGADGLARRLSAVVAEKLAEVDRTVSLKNALQDAEALAIVKTNRGKALMDEANVFLSGITRAADERLTAGVEEQRTNALRLRWVSIVGAVVIVLVVAGVALTVSQYTREIAGARDEVRRLNTGLESRVAARTAELARARDRAEVLLAEGNHRVANSLQMVASLVKLQANAITDAAAKKALAETQARIHAVGLMHTRLYTSGDARLVPLDEYLAGLLDSLSATLAGEGRGASVKYELAPLKLPTDGSINLGVVVNEWVTNAFKYAYPDRQGEVRVRLCRRDDGQAELLVEDDGIGRRHAAPAKGTGLGNRLALAMAGMMRGTVEYFDRNPGTTARLVFPLSGRDAAGETPQRAMSS